MEQKIVCNSGKCIDMNYLDCEERFENEVDIIAGELLKQMEVNQNGMLWTN